MMEKRILFWRNLHVLISTTPPKTFNTSFASLSNPFSQYYEKKNVRNKCHKSKNYYTHHSSMELIKKVANCQADNEQKKDEAPLIGMRAIGIPARCFVMIIGIVIIVIVMIKKLAGGVKCLG